jgi:predicted amidophosphoribosyltransferase
MGKSFRLRPRVFDHLKEPVFSWIAGGASFALQGVVDFLFEDSCLVCGGGGTPRRKKGGAEEETAGPLQAILVKPLCIRMGPFELVNHPVCPSCALGFEEARELGFLGFVRNGCVETPSGERFSFAVSGRGEITGDDPAAAVHVVSPFMTNDNVLRLVHLMKYKSFTSLVPVLAACTALACEKFGILPARGNPVLVPVPSNQADVRKRGYAHTTLMARCLSRALAVPVSEALAKVRKTARQSRTDESRRSANVRGAYTAGGAAGRDILLVDDLLTSGSTAAACSSALLGAGARSVTVLTFGRAK